MKDLIKHLLSSIFPIGKDADMTQKKSEKQIAQEQRVNSIISCATEHPDWSGAKIAKELGYSARSVQEILKKNALNRPTSVSKKQVVDTSAKKPVSDKQRISDELLEKKNTKQEVVKKKEPGEKKQPVKSVVKSIKAAKSSASTEAQTPLVTASSKPHAVTKPINTEVGEKDTVVSENSKPKKAASVEKVELTKPLSAKEKQDLAREEKVKAVVLCATEHPDWSGAKIAKELGYSARSVQDILKKNNLNRQKPTNLKSEKKAYVETSVETFEAGSVDSFEQELEALSDVKKEISDVADSLVSTVDASVDSSEVDQKKTESKNQQQIAYEEKVKTVVLCATEHPDWSGAKIARELGYGVSSVHQILRKNGLNRPSSVAQKADTSEKRGSEAADLTAEDVDRALQEVFASRNVEAKAGEEKKEEVVEPVPTTEIDIVTEADSALVIKDESLEISEKPASSQKNDYDEKTRLVLETAKRHPDWSGSKVAKTLGFNVRGVQKIIRKFKDLFGENAFYDVPLDQLKVPVVSDGEKEPIEDSVSTQVANNQPALSGEPKFLAKARAERANMVSQSNKKLEENNTVIEDKPANKPEGKVIKPKLDENGDYIVNQVSAFGSKRRVKDVLNLNEWSFGSRLSPKAVRAFRQEFDVPEEFVRLATYSDGGFPVKNEFLVSGQAYLFDGLIPYSPHGRSYTESLATVNESIKSLYEGYTAFGFANKGSDKFYLAFNEYGDVYLLNTSLKRSQFVAAGLYEFCLMLK